MKPLKIDFQAFGPYNHQQIIDFSLLADHSFFLIHGPTGSGKTTILDAISYALYGDTSGAEREARQMRALGAPADKETYVIFDFSLAEKRYRVLRRPEQDRPKKRGEGFKKINPEATLWEIDPGGDEIRVIESKATRVTEEVERLLGFKSDQFRQVIMLPQGQFRKLLMADSRDRQAVLETLFEAEKYRRLEEFLKNKAKAAEDELKDLRRRREGLLADAQAENEAGLAEKQAELEARLKNVTGRLAELVTAEAQALERLTAGREADRKIKAADQAAQELAKLEAVRPDGDRKRGVLERARAAMTVVPVEEFLEERLSEEKNAQAALKKAETALEKARKDQARAEADWTAEESRADQREQAQRQVHVLEALQDKAGRLQILRDASDQEEKQAKSRRAALSKAEKAVKEAEVKRSNLAQTRDGARQTAGRLEALVLEEERLALVLAKRQTLVEKEKEAGEKQSAWTKCQTATRKAIGRLDALTTEYEAAENEWRSGQASLLARDLKPGQPCPVCGAEDHPRPAPPSLLVPTQADWQAVKTKVDDARRALDQARTLEAEAEREWVRVRSEADALTADLGDAAGQGPEALAAEVQAKESERQAAEKAARRAAEADRDLQATDADLARSRTKLETARTESGQADTAAAAALAEYKAALEDLPEALRAPGALPEALSRAVKTRDDLIRQFETTRKEFQKAETDRSAADSAFQAARSHQDEARVQREEQERALDLAVSRAGFSGREDYRAARMSHDDQESLQKDIRRFETDLAAVGEAARKAQAEAQGLAAPDLEALERAHQQAGTDHRNAVDERARLDVEQARLARLAADLERIGREFQTQEAAFSYLGRLAQVAAGDNPHNLNFQRFVLAALLDDVLDAASKRLKRMTGGRYHLERAAEGQDRRRAWGLDLEVFDGYTGHNRAVATLSGGESFLASLALALGLADVVQAYSGGLRLDAVFVDEGFGSLDAEALDLALNALMDLQAGGRMVGLISHVPEMKERIAARLEVIPTRSGSSARFVSG